LIKFVEKLWKKPGREHVKINVDALFHAETLSGACGAIVRDDHGDFIAAATWFLPHVRDVDSAELIAIRNGMFLTANLCCNKVEIESDCSFVVDSVKLMDEYLGPDVTVVMECKQMALDLSE
jgi:hypothetical protein